MVRLEKTYIEDRVVLDPWRQLYLVGLCPYLLTDGEGTFTVSEETPVSSI